MPCTLVFFAACAEPNAPPITPSADDLGLPAAFAARLDAAGVEAEALDRAGDVYALAETADGTLIQWARLDSVVVQHVVGPLADGAGPGAGLYHPTAPSPLFETMPPGTVARQQSADPNVLAVLNGAFFETPGRDATRLAFPVSENGTVVSGGSSPNGPGRPGAERERWGRTPLRALALDADSAHVSDYDPATGGPLGLHPFAEAVVTYAPAAHPTRAPNRFHVLGPVGGSPSGELLVATASGVTIDALSALAARLGVAPAHQVALDGGASVYVWNRRAGTLARPTAAGGNDPQHLPHFLLLRLR